MSLALELVELGAFVVALGFAAHGRARSAQLEASLRVERDLRNAPRSVFVRDAKCDLDVVGEPGGRVRLKLNGVENCAISVGLSPEQAAKLVAAVVEKMGA